jgi:uncharacterized DUF497 family protein
MVIVWDEPKRQQNLAKHGLDFADLDVSFFLSASIRVAKTGRAIAIGEFQGRIIGCLSANGTRGDLHYLHAARQPEGKE